jgi:hypothetical protein
MSIKILGKKGCDYMAVDPQFGANVYNRAKVLNESQTLVNNILMILFGKPGFYPSIPTLGMDITQYLYTFDDEFDIDFLKSQLALQCKDFVEYIRDGSFDIIKSTYKNQPLLIFVVPTVMTNTETNLLLGVTVNEKGDYSFNFTFDNTQYI